MKKVNLNNIRPIWSVDDDNFILSKIGSYSKIFELKLPPIFTMSNEEYDLCVNDFNSLFSILPDYVMIHKMDLYTKKKFDSNKILNPNNDLLKESYKRKYNEAPFIDHVCYLTISQTSRSIKKNNSLTSLVFKNNFIPKDLKSEETKRNFENIIERIKAIIKESKSFSIIELNKSEILELYKKYETLSFSGLDYSADIYQDSQLTKVGMNYISALAINSLDCLPNEYENTYVDTNYSTDHSNLKFSLFHPIGLGFKENHIVNQVWLKENNSDVKLELSNIDNYNLAFIAQDSSNPLNLKDSKDFAILLEKGHNPVSYHCNVMIWNTDKLKLDSIENELIAKFKTIQFIPNSAYNEILPLYWSCYPGNIADLGYTDQMFKLLDVQASALSIFETTRSDNHSDFGMYMCDRYTGIPIYVDLSDLPMKHGVTNNRNKMIIGPSGSGKSFLTNAMVNSYLDFNTHVVIIDVGDSYKRLCELRGGTYLTFTTEKPISFNPFFIGFDDITNENRNGSTWDKIDIEKKEFLTTLIFTLLKKTPGEETKAEYAIYSDSLRQYYNYIDESKDFMVFNSYYRFMIENYFPKLDPKKAKLIDEVEFETVLCMFYKGGEYDYLLNSSTNIDLVNHKLIVFELDNIKDHTVLFPVVTLVIMDTFITKMRMLENTRKVLLLEEAWKAITKDGMAEFLVYLFKTVRKHFGEAWLVTQELNDIIGNPIVKNTVIKNCGAKILLDMREYAEYFDEVQVALSLSNKAKELALSLNKNNTPGPLYKEVFVGLGNEGSVYAVNVSKEEAATYTSDKIEREKIESLAKKYGDLETAIKIYAEEL